MRTMVVLAAAFAAGLAFGADPPVAVLRIESLDRLAIDFDRMAALAGTQKSADELASSLALSSFNLKDVSFVDRRKPLALVLPANGMMFGNRGIVAVLPVADSAAALKTLGASFDRVTVAEDGFHELVREGASPLLALGGDGLLLLSASRELVRAVDPRTALALSSPPPGNVVLEVAIEPLAPLIQMGLQSASEASRKALAGGAKSGMNPNATAVMQIYFDALRDVTANLKTVQLAVEIGPSDAMLHVRLLPRVGTTLEGLIQAQKGGLPDLVRHVDSEEAAVYLAGQITLTPAFRAALLEFSRKAIDAMGPLVQGAPGSPVNPMFGIMAQSLAKSGDGWLACLQGSFVNAVALDEHGAMRTTQVSAPADVAKCKAFVGEVTKAMAGAPADPQAKATVTENALQYAGVQATRQEVQLILPEGVEHLFAGGSVVTYTGVAGDLLLSTGGGGAEQRFKQLVDRVAAKTKAAGATPHPFSPLRIGPGIFAVYDMGALASIGTAAKDGAPPPNVFRDLPPGVARLVYAGRFDKDALTVEVAFPLELIKAFTARAAAQPQPPEKAP